MLTIRRFAALFVLLPAVLADDLSDLVVERLSNPSDPVREELSIRKLKMGDSFPALANYKPLTNQESLEDGFKPLENTRNAKQGFGQFLDYVESYFNKTFGESMFVGMRLIM